MGPFYPSSFPGFSHTPPALGHLGPRLNRLPLPSTIPLNTLENVRTVEDALRGDRQGNFPGSSSQTTSSYEAGPYLATQTSSSLVSSRTPPLVTESSTPDLEFPIVTESSTPDLEFPKKHRKEIGTLIDNKAARLQNFSQEIRNPYANVGELVNRLSAYLEQINLFNLSYRLTNPASDAKLKKSSIPEEEVLYLLKRAQGLDQTKLQFNRFLDILIHDKVQGNSPFNWKYGGIVKKCFSVLDNPTQYYLTTDRIKNNKVAMFCLSHSKASSRPFWIAISALYRFQKRSNCGSELFTPFLDSLLEHIKNAPPEQGLKEPQEIEVRFPSSKEHFDKKITLEGFIEEYLKVSQSTQPSQTSTTSTTSIIRQEIPLQPMNLSAQSSRPPYMQTVGRNPPPRPYPSYGLPPYPGHPVQGYTQQPPYSQHLQYPFNPSPIYHGTVPRALFTPHGNPFPPRPPFHTTHSQPVQTVLPSPSKSQLPVYWHLREKLGPEKMIEIERKFKELVNRINVPKGVQFNYKTWPERQALLDLFYQFIIGDSKSQSEKIYKALIYSVWLKTILFYAVPQLSKMRTKDLYDMLLKPNVSKEDFETFCMHAIEVLKDNLMASQTSASNPVPNQTQQVTSHTTTTSSTRPDMQFRKEMEKRRADKLPAIEVEGEKENLGVEKPKKRRRTDSQALASRSSLDLAPNSTTSSQVASSENEMYSGNNQQAFDEPVVIDSSNVGLDVLATKMAQIQPPVPIKDACGLNLFLRDYQQNEVQELIAANKANISRMLTTPEGIETNSIYFEFLMQLLMQGSEGAFAIVAPKNVVDDTVPDLRHYLMESLFTAWKAYVQNQPAALGEVVAKIKQLLGANPAEVQDIHLGLLLYSLLPIDGEANISDDDLAKHAETMKTWVENHLNVLNDSEKQTKVRSNLVSILDRFAENPALPETTRAEFQKAKGYYQLGKSKLKGLMSLVDRKGLLPTKTLMIFWASLLAYHPERSGHAEFAKYPVENLKPLLDLSANSIVKATSKVELTKCLEASVTPQFIVTSFETLRAAKKSSEKKASKKSQTSKKGSTDHWEVASSKPIARIVVDKAHHLNHANTNTTKALDAWVRNLRTKFPDCQTAVTMVTEMSAENELSGLFELLKRSLNTDSKTLLNPYVYNDVNTAFVSAVEHLSIISENELNQTEERSNSSQKNQRTEFAKELCKSFARSFTLKETIKGLFSHLDINVESNIEPVEIQMELSPDVIKKIEKIFNKKKQSEDVGNQHLKKTAVTQLNLHHEVMKILLHPDLACAKKFTLKDPDVEAVLNKFIAGEQHEKEAFIKSSPLLKAVLTCDKVDELFKKGQKSIFACEHSATMRFFQEALKFQFGATDEQFNLYKGKEEVKRRSISWFKEKNKDGLSRHLFLMQGSNKPGLNLSEADGLVQLGINYNSSKKFDKRLADVGNKEKKWVITPTAKIFFFDQQKAIRHGKECLVNFYKEVSSDVNHNFKLYRELVLAECYHKFLNDFKDEAKAKAHLAYATTVFDEIQGKFLSTGLLEQRIAQIKPQVQIAAPVVVPEAEPEAMVMEEPPTPGAFHFFVNAMGGQQ